MSGIKEQAIEQITLPDGLEIVCANSSEAGLVWQEIQTDSPFAAAVEGLTADDWILDIGAHIGLASVFFAHRLPGVRILAFEPGAVMGECLEQNLARHAENGTALRLAVGAQEGECEFFYYPYASSMSTLYVDEADENLNFQAFMDNTGIDEAMQSELRKHEQVRVRSTVGVTTLTEVFGQYGIDQVGLLKIDVERAELDVLNGLDEELWPRVRRILMEVHDCDGRLGKVVGRLAGRGYQVRVSQASTFAGGSVFMVFASRD